MSTKEMILEELNTLDENTLNEIYGVIRQFVESKKDVPSSSLMKKLKRIKIDAPTDFATNLDLYVSGEKRVQ